ncbi:MAG: exodeoxyribonuclease VII small subunit [Sciscionella sp.]
MAQQSGSEHEQPGQETAQEELGYEAAREELATVVGRLEDGGLSLEESLTLWERGEALAKLCERHLAGAAQRVEAALAVVEHDESASRPATS